MNSEKSLFSPTPEQAVIISMIISEAYGVCARKFSTEDDLNLHLGKIKVLEALHFIPFEEQERITHELVHIFDHRLDK